jgi:hypothetical protein
MLDLNSKGVYKLYKLIHPWIVVWALQAKGVTSFVV